MAAQSDLGQTHGPRRSFAGRLVKALLSIESITVILSFAFILPFDDWRLAGAGGIIVTTLLFRYVGFLFRYASLFSRCILPFLIGGLCVEAYVVVHSMPVLDGYIRYLRFNEFYKEPFYTAISTLYAIITALALIKAIEDFDTIKANVAEEAHKVRSMLDMTTYFDGSDETVQQWVVLLQEHLKSYARNVSSLVDTSVRSVNFGILRECQHAIAQLKPADDNDRFSLQKLMEERADLATLRVKRMNSIGETAPRYLIVALWLVSASLILPFFAEPLTIPNPSDATLLIANPAKFTQYYMIFLMGTLYSFLLLMLSDINNPFDGFWVVDMQAFDELTELFDTELAKDRGKPQTAAA